MKQLVEAVTLEGQTVRVNARAPLPVAAKALAIAAAIRVLDRYPALDRLALSVGGADITVTRQEVEQLLGPEGFSGLKDRDTAREVLERAIREYAGEDSV
jgi:hypothetical protein